MLRLGNLWGVAVAAIKSAFELESTFELKGTPLACVGASEQRQGSPPPLGTSGLPRSSSLGALVVAKDPLMRWDQADGDLVD